MARICDYEGHDYEGDFWANQGREYEDLAERYALRGLLPAHGRRLLDVGAGFGRLSEFYAGYDQVVLLDYSRSLLRQAQKRLGRDPRYVYVAASFYTMPFARDTFDAAMMVRVIHHVADVPALLSELARVLTGGATFVLEHANKRHLKAIARYALRRQAWNPFAHEPYEFVEMNFDFHPDWMRARLAEAMFHVKHTRTVSHFRLPLLKRLLPAPMLAAVDSLLQPTGAWWQLAPSVFFQAETRGPVGEPTTDLLWRCPACGGWPLQAQDDALACPACARTWPVEDGIYNFKDPSEPL